MTVYQVDDAPVPDPEPEPTEDYTEVGCTADDPDARVRYSSSRAVVQIGVGRKEETREDGTRRRRAVQGQRKLTAPSSLCRPGDPCSCTLLYEPCVTIMSV